MKRLMMLFAALALVLSASAAFAGFTVSQSSQEGAALEMVNNTDNPRVFVITVSCSEGSQTDNFPVDAHGSVWAQNDEQTDLDMQIDLKVTDDGGEALTQATVYFKKGTFSPGQIGEGVYYEAVAPDQAKLISNR